MRPSLTSLQRRIKIAIGDVGHFDTGRPQEACKCKLRHARCGSPIDLAGLGARACLQSSKRINIHSGVRCDGKKRI
jgi:hypothetical protein